MIQMRAGAARVSSIHRRLPLRMLLLSLALTAALCVWSLRSNAARARALLERRAEGFAPALSSRLQSYLDTLARPAGLRPAGHAASDAEFGPHVRAISLQNRFPGLALTFVAQWVPALQRDALVDGVRSDRSANAAGHPDFDARPPGPHPGHTVLRHTYPFDAGSFGCDLFDPTLGYRSAVEQSLSSGRYVATAPLLLARDRFKTGHPELTSIVIRGASMPAR